MKMVNLLKYFVFSRVPDAGVGSFSIAPQLLLYQFFPKCSSPCQTSLLLILLSDSKSSN